MATVVIAGAGLLGRLLAWRLSRAGHAVQVVDPALGPQAPATGQLGTHAAQAAHAAGFTAAGMLSPLAELDSATPALARLGQRSLGLWQGIAQALGEPDLVRCVGSLMLTHASDRGAAARVLARLQVQAPLAGLGLPQALGRDDLMALEPALAPGLHGWWLAGEGQVLPREMLQALQREAIGVQWHWQRRVSEVSPGQLLLDDGQHLRADWVIDVRGLGARAQLPLRGVRGELLWLHAPGVSLQRPLRLLHPRHRVYLVPRPGDLVVVGASEVESEDRSPVSLRSAVELMAAAHSVIPELAEARIVHLESNLRPALPDHHPTVRQQPGLLEINGLYRHGWLIAPALVQDALADLPELCHD
jgi:glycine oxidase